MFQNEKQVGIHMEMTNILWIVLISLRSFDRLKVFEKNVFMGDFKEKKLFYSVSSKYFLRSLL